MFCFFYSCLFIIFKHSPKWVNDDEDWYDQRGLNALQILSYLLSGYNVNKLKNN